MISNILQVNKIISNNALSIYIIQHEQNKIYEQNIHLIQDAMLSEKPSGSKFKTVRIDFPNLGVLTKSATSGEIQEMYAHASIGNKYIGKTVTAYAMVGYLEAPTMVSIKIEHSFAGSGNKFRLPTMEVLLCAATIKLEKSKNLQDWTSSYGVLLPPLLTDVALTE